MKLPLNIPDLSLAPASPRFIDYQSEGQPGPGLSMAQELTAGLCAESASVAPKFFYNALGSKLFEAITELAEYYPTRTEAAIFEASQRLMASALVRSGISQACLIDLGAGNCAKAMALIPHLAPRQYVPVDISVDFLRVAAERVQSAFPALDIIGLGLDFSARLVLPDAVQPHDRVFFYPGSSLGNFSPEAALQFLQHLADPAQGRARGLLLGIDLVKDRATLEAAYDDGLGVTAAFNKNLLLNVNDLLQSDFDVRQWRHVALYNAAQSRIEMHLEAMCNLSVRWPSHERRFQAGERIHTENSYKYTLEGMTALMHSAGFEHVEYWIDPKHWFAVFWAAV
ncbi:dimethylhistidine N-methyltransferase [Polaromonas sp. OV174]|uniref:L-histidine N(alpha)-methyltransferase n=1 Tax=Polaromonas sp. OV174 TaxID=1855300 RepID=UPI0008E6BAEF|nr:L-histidine N(alpha)-methyltransferase [Polaromonas sp. OV174]SFC11976.1 dimethylhistidine N-methyltransferase [Polaromonas sp. OV174]